LGEISNFFSINVTKLEDGSVLLDQWKYTSEVLVKYDLDECSAKVNTPLQVQGKCSAKVNTPLQAQGECSEISDSASQQHCDELLYRGAVGCLMYLSTSTRPDLSFALCKVSQKCSKPTKEDWNNVKHIMMYLKKVGKKGLHYQKTNNPGVKIFVDADWASDVEDRKSISGFVATCGEGAINWHSRKQQRVTTSSQHAELMALKEGCKEVIWMQLMFKELSCEEIFDKPSNVFVDNQGAIAQAKSFEMTSRNKHIAVDVHFIRDIVRRGEVNCVYVPTDENLADCMTKVLNGRKTKVFVEKLGLKSM